MAGFAANLSRGEDEQRVEQVAYRPRLTPPGGANDRCDCDGYRPDTSERFKYPTNRFTMELERQLDALNRHIAEREFNIAATDLC